MENQHRQITGYRELTQDEIDLMNKIKAKAEEVGRLAEQVMTCAGSGRSDDGDARRWAAIGKTDLQIGFMALVRSVARPSTF